ncbi:UDP-glucuronosyl/UDP-glucosyltransferase protein [Dioscorea alata]|uniref:UDP-glucuronosyl/UDP-glucosyltransferase protein n=1 Tax=Dioscorea alata TaxID=55571 RepID=A0ACB7WRT9_DIOAL|nr:UDP-glucuronosyl/UDP-glucosyltransferase protein [Dioscorea alata]
MEFSIPWFPSSFCFHRSQLSSYMCAVDGSDAWSLFLQKHIRLSFSSDALLCHTTEEVEPLGLRILRCNTGLKVYPIGPLNLLPVRQGGKKPEMAYVAWLDTHPAGSVIYVSFGSQSSILASQMKSLATGLEASRKPFIWVIRPPIGFDVNGEMKEEWLPEGFSKRISESGQGLLVERWAPQLEILAHKSTGVFISHCGWNSVLESLSQGVPIIGWPLISAQFYNSKMMEEELGLCLELARGVEDEVDSVEVERVVRLALDGEKGKKMKKAALKCMENMRETMKDDGGVKGSSLFALDEFIKNLFG